MRSLGRGFIVKSALILFLFGSNGGLLAQEGGSVSDSVKPKSPFLAFVLSSVATGVPVGYGLSLNGSKDEDAGMWLTLGGIIIGPATGYIYGGETGRGLKGVGIRLAISGGAFLLMGAAVGRSSSLEEGIGAIVILGGVGLAVVAGDALYDIFTVGSTVSKHNSLRRVFGVTVTPVYARETRSMGIQLTMGL